MDVAAFRFLAGVFVLTLAAGCGGSEPSTPPPPPGPPSAGPPAAISTKAGDNQQAAPGAPVAIAPSVLVADAAGRPVPNVQVTFSVESGGGTIAHTTASTGTDGVTSPGDWTLGPAEGANVLKATAGSAGSLSLHAEGVFPITILAAGVSVPASGGTVSYQKPGDPFDGVELTVPSRAYATAHSWSISGKPMMKVALPAGVTQIGGVLQITVDGGYADSAMALRIPARAGLDTAVAAFYYDPATKFLEALPVIARDNATITVGTRHFSPQFLWQPAQPGIRQTSAALFDPISIIVTGVPASQLAGPITTGFSPPVDGWEFTNNGSQIEPTGICAGMSISAIYFYGKIKPTVGFALFHHYDRVPNYDWDNPLGIRFASMVQHDYSTLSEYTYIGEVYKLAHASSVPIDVVEYQSLLVAMRTTGQPQLLTLRTAQAGHAVIAFGANAGNISLADPNQPGVTSTATFANGAFQTVLLATLASNPKTQFTVVRTLGTSSVIPTATLDNLWQQFLDGTVGDGTFADLTFETFDQVTNTHPAITGPIATRQTSLQFELECAACTPTRFDADVVNPAGVAIENPLPIDVPGPVEVGLLASLNQGKFVNFKWATVNATPFFITPAVYLASTGDQVDYVAHPSGPQPQGTQYVWTFDDTPAPVVQTDDSTLTHTYIKAGTVNAVVAMKDPTGKVLAQATITVSVTAPRNAWSLDSLRVVSQGGGNTAGDMAFPVIQSWMNDVHAIPDRAVLFLFPQPTVSPKGGTYQGFWFQVSLSNTVADQFDPTLFNSYAHMASSAPGGPAGYPNQYTLTGTTKQGTIVGQGLWGINCTMIVGRINAVFKDTQLIGTMELILLLGGANTYSFKFAFGATQQVDTGPPEPVAPAMALPRVIGRPGDPNLMC